MSLSTLGPDSRWNRGQRIPRSSLPLLDSTWSSSAFGAAHLRQPSSLATVASTMPCHLIEGRVFISIGDSVTGVFVRGAAVSARYSYGFRELSALNRMKDRAI